MANRQPLKRELAAQNEALRAELSQLRSDRDRECTELNHEINRLQERVVQLIDELHAEREVLSDMPEPQPSTREELMAYAKRFSISHKVPTRIENGAVKYFSNGHWHTAS